eukprot:m.356233 g.356233  ORF g.356233 m.356233 type:complete len:73 (-) comp16604_c0_seq7:7088-7306(-)
MYFERFHLHHTILTRVHTINCSDSQNTGQRCHLLWEFFFFIFSVNFLDAARMRDFLPFDFLDANTVLPGESA